MKILMADDSSFMRSILTNILKKENYTDLVEAVNGDEAVSKFKSEKPDLVLLDIIMEKKDGIEVLKEIKEIDPSSKVVMVSAVGQEQMVEEAMKLGAENFIVKPFDSNKVIETIKEIFGK